MSSGGFIFSFPKKDDKYTKLIFYYFPELDIKIVKIE